jgi:AcrR family transcriptional regulator
VFTRRQEGALARTHEGEPGLPRGKNRLPPAEVQAAQRARLLGAVIAAVGDGSFSDVTVADIVRGARVSRAAFYAHFSDKEDCFIAACREGGRLMTEAITAAKRSQPPGTGPEQVLRASLAAFLAFLAREPAFARAFYIEMPAAGPRAARLLRGANHHFARFNRSWHERARLDRPDWPEVPAEAYYALAGASAELVRAKVSQDMISSLTDLEDTLVALHLAVLAGQAWPRSGETSALQATTSGA